MYSLRLRKVTEEFNGIPCSWITAVSGYGLLTVFVPLMIFLLSDSIIVKLLMIIICLAAILVFYVKMRTPAKLHSTMLELKYRIRVHKGEHIIPKHTVPLTFLKGLVPLESVHPNGLIQFTNNRYGIIYRLFVPRKTGDDLDVFIQLVTKNIVDRIHDRQVLKVFEMQRYTRDTSIKNQVVEAMNDESKTPEQREHLNSIYQKLIKNTEIPTERFIYAFIALGRFNTPEDAGAERTNLIPSLHDGFKLGGIGYRMLIFADEIGMAYRRCMK
ncbi:MAG: hypothetical protein E4G94_02505 [ANME-2 cluster archaeon]|nr:MAG: hypothetical protein E4G94_02505 [ANME-2 cluster archaeon]